ncbi:MAG: PEP-CTERM sorting domain-containing protein [Symploca sp. SIO2D2]|nr:PEP-CTERM sorting domain-containing protein [Symploca sp. SIO2D2]
MTTLLSTFGSLSADAAIIDFETGFQDLEPVNTLVASDGNILTFSVGSGTSGGSSPAFIAEVGLPITAFGPDDGEGTFFESQIGNYVLTDFTRSSSNPSFNYFIEFEESVSNFSVDLLDYTEVTGSNVTVTAYSDSFITIIGSAIGSPTSTNTTVSLGNTSLNTISLGALGGIHSISIIGNIVDAGTAIDNISFTTEKISEPSTSVPEPSTIFGTGLALGLGGFLNWSRRKKLAQSQIL